MLYILIKYFDKIANIFQLKISAQFFISDSPAIDPVETCREYVSIATISNTHFHI